MQSPQLTIDAGEIKCESSRSQLCKIFNKCALGDNQAAGATFEIAAYKTHHQKEGRHIWMQNRRASDSRQI